MTQKIAVATLLGAIVLLAATVVMTSKWVSIPSDDTPKTEAYAPIAIPQEDGSVAYGAPCMIPDGCTPDYTHSSGRVTIVDGTVLTYEEDVYRDEKGAEITPRGVRTLSITEETVVTIIGKKEGSGRQGTRTDIVEGADVRIVDDGALAIRVGIFSNE